MAFPGHTRPYPAIEHGRYAQQRHKHWIYSAPRAVPWQVDIALDESLGMSLSTQAIPQSETQNYRFATDRDEGGYQ
jgi:hypothetical protein